MRNIVIYRSSICGTKELGEWKLSTPLKILLRQCSSRVVERHSGHSCFGLVYFDMFQIETFNPIENTSEAIFIEFEGG